VRRDPGRYTVSLKSEHCTAEDKTFSLAEGETYDLRVAFKQTDAEATKPIDEPKRTGGTMAPAAVAFGIGGAGLVVGAIFAGLAFDQTDWLYPQCKNNVCPKDLADAVSIAQTDGDVSTAMFVVGGVGVATGIVLAVTVGRGSSSPSDEKKSAFVAPYVIWSGTTKGAGIQGAF
jgi:hypothetical protein